jgi:hypothetical protein
MNRIVVGAYCGDRGRRDWDCVTDCVRVETSGHIVTELI